MYQIPLPWKRSRLGLIAAAGHDRRLRFSVMLLCTMGTVAFSFASPQIIRWTIDSIIDTKPLDAPGFVRRLVNALGGLAALHLKLWIPAAFLAGAALVSGFCNMGRRYISLELGETMAWRLRNTLYRHIQSLPWDWHVGCQTGDIIQRCTSDVDTVKNFIQTELSEFIRIVCIFCLALAMMFSMDVVMTWSALALMPIIFLFSFLYFKRVRSRIAEADAAEGAMQADSQENYTGVRVVRAFGRERYELEKYHQKTERFARLWIAIGKMMGLYWASGDFLSGLQLVLVLAMGIWRAYKGAMTAGTFLAFFTYSNNLVWPVRRLARILADLSRAMVSAQRLRTILEVTPEDTVDRPRPNSDSLYLSSGIVFDNVSFSYPNGTAVLHNVSFSLGPGETLAILGATGSGKSTLVHLLDRLYDLQPGCGRILLDGRDIRDIDRRTLRRSIGLCLQEPFLFSRTIRENIAITRPDLSLDEIRRYAQVAQIDSDVMGFATANGSAYDTLVGERGVTLSGGQKQRVAIARMLARKPAVMIFDDSLSAVDTETDAAIREGLYKSFGRAAVIIISHRIASLMQAGHILVLKDGAVEDYGTHRELIAREGTYKRIYEIQKGAADGRQ